MKGSLALLEEIRLYISHENELACVENGDSYTARFPTDGSFQNIRIPFKAFRRTEEAVGEAVQQLDPRAIRSISLRVDLKSQPQVKRTKKATKDLPSLSDSSTQGAFRLELNRIHVCSCSLWLRSSLAIHLLLRLAQHV